MHWHIYKVWISSNTKTPKHLWLIRIIVLYLYRKWSPPTCLVEKSSKQLRASNQNKSDCLSCGCRSHCASGHLHKIELLSTFPCSMLRAFKFLVAQQVAVGCKARSHSQWTAAYSCLKFWVYVTSPSWIIIGPRGVLHKSRIKKSRITEKAWLDLVCAMHPGLIGCMFTEPGWKGAAMSSQV